MKSDRKPKPFQFRFDLFPLKPKNQSAGSKPPRRSSRKTGSNDLPFMPSSNPTQKSVLSSSAAPPAEGTAPASSFFDRLRDASLPKSPTVFGLRLELLALEPQLLNLCGAAGVGGGGAHHDLPHSGVFCRVLNKALEALLE